VKQALKAGKPSIGTWLSLGNITAARFLARAGFAWLTFAVCLVALFREYQVLGANNLLISEAGQRRRSRAA